jgi:segregation and condensation protein B
MSEPHAPDADVLEGGVPPARADAEEQVDVHALPGGLRGALEAVLMVVDEPVPVERLAQVTGVPVAEVAVTLDTLAATYRDEQRGFELRQVGGGWRVYSAPAFGDVVARFVLEGQTARLTQAALETLAVVAYRQPVTRGQVSAVRGVNVDGVMRTLVARGLVAEVGTEPSGAHLYGTTASFLERMGFTSIDQLPPLAPYLPDIDGLDDLGPQARVTSVPGGPSSPTSMKEQQ